MYHSRVLVVFFLFFWVGLFYPKQGYAQCVNSDFSFGDFTNWTGSTAENILGVWTNQIPGIEQGIPNLLGGRQTLMTVSAIDPNTAGGLNVLPPGGCFVSSGE